MIANDSRDRLSLSKKNVESFWKKVIKTKKCWQWSGFKTDSEYGQILINRRKYRAHRISWMIHYGPIPQGKCILHRCDVRTCIKPDHLFLGSYKDNNQDMWRKGRGRSTAPPSKGEDNSQAKLTAGAVRRIRRAWRLDKNLTHKKLALKYDVCPGTILNIVNLKTWKHIS